MAERQEQKPDPSDINLPPQNIEAEESIISAILIDNNTLLDVIEILHHRISTGQPTKRYLLLLPTFLTKQSQSIL